MDALQIHSDEDASAALPWESIGLDDDGPQDPSAVGPTGGLDLPGVTADAADEVPTETQEAEDPDRYVAAVPVGGDDVPVQESSDDQNDDDDEPKGPPVRGGGWTIPLLCAGLCIIACCLIIPQADLNRRAAYERRTLEIDLASVQKQVAVNDEFLHRVADDPTLAERLAQRQMKIVRKGSRVLNLDDEKHPADMSPFQLTKVAPPQPLPPYKPVGGVIAGLCYQPRLRLYLTGIGLLMVAGGLVLGLGPRE